MNRRQSNSKSSVFQYFKLNENETHFICQIKKDVETCGTKISAYTGWPGYGAPSRASNLKRHVQRKHPDIYNSVQRFDEEKKKAIVGHSDSKLKPNMKLAKCCNFENITIKMTAEKFKSHLIDLAIKDEVALTFFSSPAFLGLIGDMAIELGVSLDRYAIEKMILEEAENKKVILKRLLRGKFLFLKIDAYTRQKINYRAINVQFIDEGNLAVRTLAFRATEAPYSIEYVKKLIEGILEEYEITKNQILSIVTDTVSYLPSAVRKLNIDECDEDTFGKKNNEDDNDFEFDNAVHSFAGVFKIPHMRCAVCTLQLAVRDGLKERNIANLIDKLRNIAVFAKTPKLDAILKCRSGRGTITDQAIHWEGTFKMIQRLLELKEYLSELSVMAGPDIALTDIHWQEASKLQEVLECQYEVINNLQVSELTPGSFYKEWKNLILKLTQIGSNFADNIIRSMEQREYNLLYNNVFLAAIYVDPIHRALLTPKQLVKGKIAFCNMAFRMKLLIETNYDVEIDFEEEKSRNSKRRRVNKALIIENDASTKFRREFIAALVKVEKFNKTKLNVKNAIPMYPEIVQNAATTVLALPSTQVSVVRLFSALSFLKSYQHANLEEDMRDAFLILRTNPI